MKIDIDLKSNVLANDFFITNKNILLNSINDSLKGFDEPASKGVTFRIPSDAKHLNKHAVKALNFIVDEVSEDIIKISLVTLEK
jgi:hypothetical protein